MCVHEPEPRLHHSSDGGGGGGGGGGNNNSQASGSSRPPARLLRRGSLRRRKESAALRGPGLGRPAARAPTTPRHRAGKKGVPPTPRPPPARGPGAPRNPARRDPSPRLPGPKVRFIYLFPVEDVGAGAAGWLEGAFSVEADRGREGASERARGAGHGSAEESDAHGAAAQALFSGRWLGLRWKLVSL